jgi:hypothetical protein
MRRAFLFSIIIVGLLAPTIAGAASWIPIVPCGSAGQQPCSPCDLFKAFHNVIDLVLYGITGPVAAFMVVVAGGMMLLSRGNVNWYKNGLQILRNTMIGVSIILLSWVFTNFLIKSLGTGSATDAWYQFSCPAGLASIVNIETTFPSGTPPVPMTSAQAVAADAATRQAMCSNPSSLAGFYSTTTRDPAVYKSANNKSLNSISLNALMTCVEKDPIVRAMYNPALKYTYEQTNPLCNLTRGFTLCGKCAHTNNSCHYGGRTGQGAMAVDYNWNGKTIVYVVATRTIVGSLSDSRCSNPGKTDGSLCRTVTGENGLFDELYRSMAINKCSYTLLNFEGNHEHISTLDCSADGGKNSISGRRPPQVP